MAEALSITSKEDNQDIVNFEFLKQTAIELIQDLSGNLWTDYNIHDPGITILEYLCYALTELGYRSRFSVADILTKENAKAQKDDLLISANKILTTRPITINDFRRILLDIEGVKNATLTPIDSAPDFKGIYDVKIELFPEFEDELNKKIIEREISIELEQNRNLCELFSKIEFAEYQSVAFEIDVNIEDDASLSNLTIEILTEINSYLSPAIRFHSLKEMLKKGYSTEEIFNGPLLKNGFILDNELEELQFREMIYSSDIIHCVMDISGIESVRNMDIITEDQKSKWVSKIKDGSVPKLDLNNTIVRFFHKGKKIQEKKGNVTSYSRISAYSKHSAHKRLKFKVEPGEHRNIGEYYSIQNDFPEVYGIGQVGLGSSESDKRKAQAKQLKAYLLFFEQILANFFAQLENLNELFSIKQISNTYFNKPLFDIPGAEYFYKPFIEHCFLNSIDQSSPKIVRAEWKKFIKTNQEEFEISLNNITEETETFGERRNKILNHLLSRFAMDFSDYRFIKDMDDDSITELIDYKINILQNIIQITKNRAGGFTNIYTDIIGDDENISGFENRLNILLGFKNNSNKVRGHSINSSFDIFKSNRLNDDAQMTEFDFEFTNTTQNQALQSFTKYGLWEKHYNVIKDNGYKINILNDFGEVMAQSMTSHKTEKEALKLIPEIIKKVKDLNDKSIGAHVIEHIFLRPPDDSDFFGFSIYDQSKKEIFRNIIFQSLTERDNLINEIIELGVDEKNFYLKSFGNNQFKIAVRDKNKLEKIETIQFFNHDENIDLIISGFINVFQQLANSVSSRESQIKYYTKYFDLFEETFDPFSFIVTILLPNWTYWFQDERFQDHVKNTIIKELPAYILPNIRFLSPDYLCKSVNLYHEILKERSMQKINSNDLNQKIKELINLII